MCSCAQVHYVGIIARHTISTRLGRNVELFPAVFLRRLFSRCSIHMREDRVVCLRCLEDQRACLTAEVCPQKNCANYLSKDSMSNHAFSGRKGKTSPSSRRNSGLSTVHRWTVTDRPCRPFERPPPVPGSLKQGKRTSCRVRAAESLEAV